MRFSSLTSHARSLILTAAAVPDGMIFTRSSLEVHALSTLIDDVYNDSVDAGTIDSSSDSASGRIVFSGAIANSQRH